MPQCSDKENKLAKTLKCTKDEKGQWITPTGQLLVTTKGVITLFKNLHETTHMGADAMVNYVKRYAMGPKMQTTADVIVKKCHLCCANNPRIQQKPPAGNIERGIALGEHWQIDFSELPKCNRFKYLLVLVDLPFWGGLKLSLAAPIGLENQLRCC